MSDRPISSSVESDHGHGTDRLDKPRQSQPVGGMRFTSQTGRRHDGTLDQLASSPAYLIQVGGSVSGNPSYGLGGRVLHDVAVLMRRWLRLLVRASHQPASTAAGASAGLSR
jgi:hypothetical protein